MKNLMTAAIIIGGTIMAQQSTFADYISSDLYLGFQNSSGSDTANYIVNLGAVSGIVGGSTVITFSSNTVSSFPSGLLGNNSGATIQGGVVGGSQYIPNIYYTKLRTSSIGMPSVAGSMAPDPVDGIEGAISAIDGMNVLNAPAAGTNVVDTGKTWEKVVDNPLVQNSFSANAHDPDSLVNIGGSLYEDLYFQNQDSTTPVYEGYFTLNLIGGTSNPVLTFTPKNAPGTLMPPVVQSVSKIGSTVTVISSNAVPTYTYQLQYTASLNPTNWINTGSSQVAGTTTVTNTDTTATDPQRFYRVQAH
jgi:hypothetical protein